MLYFARPFFQMFNAPTKYGGEITNNGGGSDVLQMPTVPAGAGAGAIGDGLLYQTPTAIVIQLAFQTAIPQETPTPAATAAGPDDGNYYDAAYSYYDPTLGGINCHSANWDGMKCADVTASGIRWSEYMGSGVAFPIAWLQVVGYGTKIQVVEPAPIAGEYTIIDICCGCDGRNWGDHRYRIDFLDTAQRLPWADGLKFFIKARTDPVQGINDGACQAGG